MLLYAPYSVGTSMSCPHVTGVAALLFSIFPDAGPEDVREAIEVTARDDGACGHDSIYVRLETALANSRDHISYLTFSHSVCCTR